MTTATTTTSYFLYGIRYTAVFRSIPGRGNHPVIVFVLTDPAGMEWRGEASSKYLADVRVNDIIDCVNSGRGRPR